MDGKKTLQSIFQDHPDANGNLVNSIIDGCINSETSSVNCKSDKTTGDSNTFLIVVNSFQMARLKWLKLLPITKTFVKIIYQ